MKEGRSQSAEESRAAAEPSVNTGGLTVPKEFSEESRKRKRITGGEELGPSEKEESAGSKRSKPVGESDEVEVISPPEPRKDLSAIEDDPMDLSVSFRGSIPTGGKEGFTLVRFQTAQGWLGSCKDAPSPLEALNAFELSLDKKALEKKHHMKKC